MSLLRVAGWARNWRLESGELKESNGSDGKSAIGSLAIRHKSW